MVDHYHKSELTPNQKMHWNMFVNVMSDICMKYGPLVVTKEEEETTREKSA